MLPSEFVAREPLPPPSPLTSNRGSGFLPPNEAERMRMAEVFRAGDTVPASGVYKAVHGGTHIPPHYVTAIYGNRFPS